MPPVLLFMLLLSGSTQFDFKDVVVKGGMKIGHFSLSFADLTLPVAGMPITVTRTYDSRDSRLGDFGNGWSLSVSDVRLQSNGVVGGVESPSVYFWRIDAVAGGLGGSRRVTNLKKRLVSITLPDGTVHTFAASVNPSSWSVLQGTPEVAQVEWVAQGSSKGRLRSTDQSGNVTFSDTRGPVWLQQDDDGTQTPYDPREWELTLPNGTVLAFGPKVGGRSGQNELKWIRDLSGSEMRFSREGIQSVDTQGRVLRSVRFERDAQGLISRVVDPNGKALVYTRDASGNLSSVTDRVGVSTRFLYEEPSYPSYLTKIVGPNDEGQAIPMSRQDYGADGRLEKITDAQGLSTVLDHSGLDQRVEVVKDRLGVRTQLEYDGYGNVTRTSRELKDASGAFVKWIRTSSEYGDARNPELPTKVTDPLGNVTLMSYHENGWPTSVTQIMDAGDRSKDRTTTTSYNAYGSPLSVTDARGVVVSRNVYWSRNEFWAPPGSSSSLLARQSEGALRESTDESGLKTTYGYNAQGQLWQVTTGAGTALAQTTTYSYDFEKGNLTGTKDARGHSTSFLYDANGQKTGQSTSRTVYGTDGAVTGTQTLSTTMTLDAEGRVTKTTYPGGASSSTSYTPSGQVAATVDALRRVTRFDYNDRGERTETVYPDGTSSQTFYDAEGRVTRSRDRSGRGSKTIYDSLGRVVSSYAVGTNGQAFLNPDGSLVSGRTIYDDAGRAIESIDELGHRSTSVYDASGAVVASTIYDGPNADIARTSRSLYDKAGRTLRSIDALGRYSEPTYEDGRVTSTASYSAAGVKLNESFTSYDTLGRVTATKDASGNVKRMVYDELGRLEKVIQATQGVPSLDGSGPYDLVTSFGYDELGRKVWQRDAKGRYTRFGYDERGRNIWRALPLGQIERMAYNAGGQLVSSTDFRGFVTTYRYDMRGRLTLKAPDSRLNEATLSYDYPDENTRIAYRGASATTQRYDAQRGWLDSVEGPNGKVEYAYNAAGQKTATASPSGTTRYGYDSLGRLKTISDQPSGAAAATPIASYSYDAVGNLAGLTRGNGVSSQYDYDDLNRLQTLTHAKGAATLASYGYTVRGDGKRTAISEQVLNADNGRVSTRNLSYEFDASGRLINERGRDGAGVAYENAFTYDSVGNRTLTIARRAANASATIFAHETSVTGVFNANDQLTSESSVVDGGAPQLREYDYDGNGAEKSVTSGGQTSTNGWSFEGKLTATAKSSGGGIANSFDANGDRLSRTENVGLASQKTTKYLVDTDVAYAQVIEERAPDSTDAAGASVLQARYVWGQGLAPLAMWRKGDDGTVRLSYYLADGQESVRQLADASGEVTDSYHFDAFGRTLSGGSGETENPFRYTGQQLDPDGRYYLRARFYNPGNGRFLSHDPLLGSESDPISMHRYLYAAADGVNGSDPSGTTTLTETGTTSSLMGNLQSMIAGGTSNALMSFGWAKLSGQEYTIENLVVDFGIGAGLQGIAGIASWAVRFMPAKEVFWWGSAGRVAAKSKNGFLFGGAGAQGAHWATPFGSLSPLKIALIGGTASVLPKAALFLDGFFASLLPNNPALAAKLTFSTMERITKVGSYLGQHYSSMDWLYEKTFSSAYKLTKSEADETIKAFGNHFSYQWVHWWKGSFPFSQRIVREIPVEKLDAIEYFWYQPTGGALANMAYINMFKMLEDTLSGDAFSGESR